MIPPAKASPKSMYGPRGVFYDGNVLAVADTGNHRVLLWFSLPKKNHAEADVVLGQRDFLSDSPNAGGDPSRGLYMPCGVVIHEGRLIVADSWNHRILIWDSIPEKNFTPPDHVVGQPNLTSTEPSKGRKAKLYRFFWCYGVNIIDEYLLVCDTGNRRVIGWKGIPDYGQKPDILLEGEDMFFWPHSIAGNKDLVFIADAGKHRVLGWRGIENLASKPSVILGQRDMSSEEYINGPQSASSLRFPYGVSLGIDVLAVADTANNRVLTWAPPPSQGSYIPANGLVGQESFKDAGENRWKGVREDTLCWPYGVHVYGDLIFIADTGNNRVVIWRRELIF